VPFKEVLSEAVAPPQAPPPPSAQTVAEGDTLSHMVLRHMREQGLRPSLGELYTRVDQVARENALPNADQIVPGQLIRFDDLPPATTKTAAMAETAPPELMLHEPAARPAAAALAAPRAGETLSLTGDQGPWRRILGGAARLSSPFGMRSHPITGKRQFHAGIDLAAPQGTAVRPLRPGVVTFSGQQGGYGNTVIMRHADGVETLYAHMSSNLVKVGDRVGVGATIGLVGTTGRSTGPHLHFEVRRAGHVFDPLPYLD
jgi:murein DD-endopeptidase MepM/ murein hydrolase activator NlpD